MTNEQLGAARGKVLHFPTVLGGVVPVYNVPGLGAELRFSGMGADDYVVKPFSLKELAARAKVALRRNAGSGEPAQGHRDENWEIEFDAYVVRYRGQEVRLTHKEFELFRYLVERPGRVLTRERLLERVWGWEKDIDARSIDAHIRRLRLKLGDARHHVETVVGLGYRFVKQPGHNSLVRVRNRPVRGTRPA